MHEPFNSKRAVFPMGRQRGFLQRVEKRGSKTFKALASYLGISERTVRDWRREKFLMPVSVVKRLSRLARIQIPQFKTRGRYDHVKTAGSLGGQAVIQKYGRVPVDPRTRLLKWREWWGREGHNEIRKNSIFLAKPINKPKYSRELAEFVGIMMGDGGMSKNQVFVTLNSKDDYLYSLFVKKLIEKLFHITPSIYYRKDAQALNLVISRINLVDFCAQIGLKVGNKLNQELDIPSWIKENINFRKVCMRGLMDTDGSLVIHKYRVNGKRYIYKKWDFCSASPLLVSSVMAILKSFTIDCRLSQDGRNVWIDSKSSVERYLKLIGTNNPKHLKRYKE